MNYLIATCRNATNLRKNKSEFFPLYIEQTVTKYIWTIIPPLLFAIGTVGNCLTILVYTRSPLKKTSMAVYMSALAVSDIIALYTGLLTEWLTIVFDSRIKNYHSVGCKIHSWLLFSSVQFSAWIIAVITVERVVCVWIPFRSRIVASTKCARTVVICLFCALLCLNAHALYGMVLGLEEAILFPVCTAVDEGYLYFFQRIWPFIDSTVYCFIPCILIITGNSLIIYKVKQNKLLVQQWKQQPCCSRTSYKSAQGPGEVSLLPLIFTLNTVFVLTTAPISVYQAVFNFSHVTINEMQTSRHVRNFLIWSVLIMVMFSNHAINCLLYCFSGANFRREMLSLFCNKRLYF